MAEQLNLTIPVTPPTLSYWRVEELRLFRGFQALPATIMIELRGTNNEFLTFLYEGATATTLLNVLNTANLTIKSLERRVLEKLIADGLLNGTISGSPD